ncbi:vascular cell adhesion protein 1-like [Paramisgurnus dabryanus]|uniref:vascular cell adhesion protein 1-like n=1 Tax=Paramisgurnus dabryanus TaxID=90735 RepID=UPI0031F35D99
MLQGLLGLFYLSAVSQLVSLTGTQAKCPLKLNPSSVVVEYDSSVSVDCSTDVTHDGIGWEVNVRSVPMTKAKLITWRVSNLRQWDIWAECFIIYNRKQCSTLLPVTVYKTPDSVSINRVDRPMIEGSQYELQCDIVNVAPVKNLIVKWFKGETKVKTETFTDTMKTPVNKTSKLQITAVRSDNGAQYRCEAELKLGADGPKPPPKVTSDSLNITVYSICALLQLNPSSVVVEYDSSVSVDCSTDVTHDGMGWEATGSVPMTGDKLVTWRVSNLRRWDIRPQCYMNYNRTQCTHLLPVTVYKTPDNVSINTVDRPMIEGSQYQLQCDIVNVAPVKNLIVKWFKGETEVKSETFNNTMKTPVNETSTLEITANRSDNGTQYRCEAELNLGAKGPQPPPKMTSKSIQITVQYL